MNAVKRHVPLRTCVSCGSKRAKRELTRIVASPDGGAEVDPSGKLPGRGAYLCRVGGCAQEPPDRGRLEYALRVRLSELELAGIRSAIETIYKVA